MDALSAEMFGNPVIEIGDYREHEAEIQGACQAIFGRPLAPEDFAALVAAPDGSQLLVTARRVDGDIGTGKHVVEFENIAVRDAAPELLETRLFARQVKSFRKFALDEIRLLAAGYAGHPGSIGGYYVWPRLGFIVYLDGLGAELARAGFEGVENTLDLFSQAGGAEWWYHNGSERPAIFYLHEESPCVVALQSYLEEKGVDVDA